MFYTDKTAFDAASLGMTFVVDDFATAIPKADIVTCDSGVVSAIFGKPKFVSDENSVSCGQFNMALNKGLNSAPSSNGSVFSVPVTAVWFSYAGFEADEANLPVDETVRAIRLSANSDPLDGSFGVTTWAAVMQITFSIVSDFVFDNYILVTLQFETQSSVVPRPAGLRLLLGAVTALGLAARRRTRSQAASPEFP